MEKNQRARLDHVAIVLYKPKYAGNIGSAARCAMNMGIEKILVVGHPGPDEETMKQMATHVAAPVVDRIRYFSDLPEALGKFQYVVGTTARRGNSNLRIAMVKPREMAQTVAELSGNNEIALVFGPKTGA